MPERSIPEWGWRLNNRTLRRTIDGSKHLLRTPPAIAFDATMYDAWHGRFDTIEVYDRDGDHIYRTNRTTFDRHHAECDRGHGRQYFMPLNRWSRDGNPPAASTPPTPPRTPMVPPVQLQIAMAL